MAIGQLSTQHDACYLELMPSVRLRLGGREVRLSEAMSALVVAVAIRKEGLSRRTLQARMWPDLGSGDASKRLRQLLWRIRQVTDDRLLDVTAEGVRLADVVGVDLRDAELCARRAIDGVTVGLPADWVLLGEELLSSWPDEGVYDEQDRWDRLRLLAMERLAERLLAAGDVLEAIEVAGKAMNVDEFSEAPHRILAAAYLARGDRASAWRVYTRYRDFLTTEMGLDPSTAFRDLIGAQATRTPGAKATPDATGTPGATGTGGAARRPSTRTARRPSLVS